MSFICSLAQLSKYMVNFVWRQFIIHNYTPIHNLHDVISYRSPINGDVMTRVEMIYPAHDMIEYTTQCTWYDMFHDTFTILSCEAGTLDPSLQPGAPHITNYYLHSNDVQWLQK